MTLAWRAEALRERSAARFGSTCAVLRGRRRSRPRSSARPRRGRRRPTRLRRGACGRARRRSRRAWRRRGPRAGRSDVRRRRRASRAARSVVAADGGDRGEAVEAFGREGKDDELAAEPELLAERLASGVGVAGQQRGQPDVAAQEHPEEGIVEFARDRNRAVDELLGVAIAAVAQRRVGGATASRSASWYTLPTSSSSEAARSTRSRSSAIVDAASACRVGGHRDLPVVARRRSPSEAPRRRARSATSSRPATASCVGAQPESLREDHGIAERPGDGLRLGDDRALLGSHAPAATGTSALATESADAQRGMGVGARQAQRLVDPVHRVRVAISHRASSSRAPPPSRAPRSASAWPIAQPRAAWRLSISASSRARCSLPAGAPQRSFGLRGAGPARGSSGSGARGRRRSSAAAAKRSAA